MEGIFIKVDFDGDYTKIRDSIESHIDHLKEYCEESSDNEELSLLKAQALAWLIMTAGAEMSKEIKEFCEKAMKEDLWSSYNLKGLTYIEKIIDKLYEYQNDSKPTDLSEYTILNPTKNKMSKHEKRMKKNNA